MILRYGMDRACVSLRQYFPRTNLMRKINLFVLLAAGGLVGGTTGAVAGPVIHPNQTITNTTEVEAYNGTSPTGFFGGSDWGPNVGAPVYNTPSASLSF